MAVRTIAFITVLLISLYCVSGCSRTEKDKDRFTVLVFKHGKIAGDAELFRELIETFESDNPGIKVKDETLPASTDEQHQFYVINLEGKSSEFDVLSMDVIWVPEFARAGWLKDISHLLPVDEREKYFPGPIQAVSYEGRLYAIPWYIDAGLLYYRKDLLEKYSLSPPETWYELIDISKYVLEHEPGMYGFIWQGKQYEGLVCNVLEFFWGNGGDVLENGVSVIKSPENVEALYFMRDLIRSYKVSPPLVTTAIEEPARHIFGNGKAVFMRNWPYAWNIFEKEGSPVKGKVGVTTLPSFPGKLPASALGGWQLGINRYSKNPEASEKLIKFFTSPEIQKRLALTLGYKPTRKQLYNDRDLIREQPFITGLYDVFMNAVPRPVTPYYMMISQIMQPEFSAAISGIKKPEDALTSAHEQIEYILRVEK